MTEAVNGQAQGELAERQAQLSEPVIRTGMFGAQTTGDTSGYGGLQVRRQPPISSQPPYGSYFDEVADALASALASAGTSFDAAVERVLIAADEMTLYVRREHLVQ